MKRDSFENVSATIKIIPVSFINFKKEDNFIKVTLIKFEPLFKSRNDDKRHFQVE